ncbi:Serine/arginine-rich splicing factor RS41 [Sesamum angolense]|uniref:Serine/arginine-rich splicing factor RS41 n=1 Tax=Sesamum angolense TaxID=2727404 RepID=A0AAE1W1J8_9LAMI|nr:Serine/arginine-rich splicing factor RS41 [Sesamum angolense]
MRPIFCGNFEYDARQSDLERLFKRYGKVDRVDMKSAVQLDHWLRLASQLNERLQRLTRFHYLFSLVMRKIISYEFRFAFVYMEDERDAEDAIRALDRIEFGRKGRRLRVEWTKQERSSRRPESSRKSSSNLRPSKTLFVINFDPYHTRTRDLERHFDPYGKTKSNCWIVLSLWNMLSRMMMRGGMDIAPTEFVTDHRGEAMTGLGPQVHTRERESPDYGHGRGRSPSPYRRASPDYARGSNRSPSRKERDPRRGHDLSASPRKERDSDYKHKHSPSPQRERSNGDIGAHTSPGKRVSPDFGRGPSPSPQREPGERVPSPDDYARDRSPAFSDAESPRPERYGSQSPRHGKGLNHNMQGLLAVSWKQMRCATVPKLHTRIAT